MSTSPTKASQPHLPPPVPTSTVAPSSPRGFRTIRRLQSAHALTSTASSSNAPSLISLQRQQQQQRNNPSGHKDLSSQGPPPVPTLPSHGRSRSNSDAPVGSVFNNGPVSRRNPLAKKTNAPSTIATKHVTLDSLIRDGPPNGEISTALRDMRYIVLTDGVLSDSDGMVSVQLLSGHGLHC